MTQLTVYVSGLGVESRLLTLLVDIYAHDGTMLAQGTASPRQAATFDLPARDGRMLDRVYVLATLPNGASLQETVELRGGQAEVTLHQGEQSPHEWLQWVTPFRSLSHLKSGGEMSTVVPRRIGQVWMTLWTLEDGRWKAQGVQVFDRQRDAGMLQLVIDVPLFPNLLQIGGEEVAWRLVSLPPGRAVRVALTRSPTEEGDSLEITIGRSDPDDELIMSYLARGAVAEADRLAEAWDVADLMLQEKKKDPVSAAAGAYLLLKSRRLQQRRDWVDNLVEWFPYMADGAIVSAALALQREDAKESEIRAKLDVALGRGLPIFAMGASVLVETMAAVHRGKLETKRFHAAYLAAQAYARALCTEGAYFAFYGKSPAEPSWTPIYGLEGDAVASPTSAPSTEAVVYARPWDGIQVGKFGATRVALPRAPVNAQVVKELLVEARRLNEESVAAFDRDQERVGAAVRLFHRSVDLGIPIVETNFLQEFSVGSERGVSLVAGQAQLPSPKSRAEQVLRAAVKRAPRQTAKYWRDERLKHAETVFDGDE